MIDLLLRKLRLRSPVSDEEEAALRAAASPVETVRPDQLIAQAGDAPTTSCLLVEGWACRHKDLPDGRRQIVELQIAGDFVDLHSFPVQRLDHDVSAITTCRVSRFTHERLREITERFPRLARSLWFSTMLDASIHREWILSLGQRDALGRIAHLLCELRIRLEIVDLGTAQGFALPLTQAALAEATGLTPVHVNRTLRALRENGIATVRNRNVNIHDLAELERTAAFDSSYLHLGGKSSRAI